MKSKEKLLIDISSNQITVSCLFNLEEVASVTYQLNGLEQGIVVDQNMFTSEIGEILKKLPKSFHVKNAVLVLNSKAINYELKQISFSFDKPTIIDHSFNQQIVQICKKWCQDQQMQMLDLMHIGYVRDEEHVQTIEGSSAMEVLVKVGVFYCSKIELINLLDSFKLNSINVLDIIPYHMVLFNQLQKNHQQFMDLGCIMLDFGAFNTSVLTVELGKLVGVQQVLIGQNSLIKLIAHKLNINLANALKLFKLYGSAAEEDLGFYQWSEVETLDQKMLCVNQSTIRELTISYLIYLLGKVKVCLAGTAFAARIVISGQMSKLEQITQIANKYLGLDDSMFIQLELSILPTAKDLINCKNRQNKKNSFWVKLKNFLGFS